MGKSYAEIPALKNADGSAYTYSPSCEKITFGDGKTAKNATKSADYENLKGEWNVIDLYCFGRTSVHVVNGKVNMISYNSGKIDNGKVEPLTKGKIQLQSEGGELFIKKLELEPIREIPAEFFK
jgi:stress response protein SCP2